MVAAHTTARPRQMTLADQRRRSAELDAIRMQRKLTPEEQAEADNLVQRAYLREWRAMQREHGAMIAARIAAQDHRMNGGAA